MLGSLMAIGMALCLATNSVIMRSLPNDVDVFLISSTRAAWGTVFLVLIVAATGQFSAYRTLTSSQILVMVASILIGGVLGDALNLSSLRILGVSRAFPILNSYPLMTMLGGVLLLGETFQWLSLMGAVMTFLGIGLISRRADATDREEQPDSVPAFGRGVVMALGTAICYACESLLVARGSAGASAIVAHSIRAPVVVAVSGAIAAGRGSLGQARHLDRRTTCLLVVGGLLGWVFAGTMWVRATQLIGPGRTAIIGSSAPLFALPLSIVFLRERPDRRAILGTLLTVIGVSLVV